jgi:hypothetical protein
MGQTRRATPCEPENRGEGNARVASDRQVTVAALPWYTPAGFVRRSVIEPGRAWAYVALFSEIGLGLLVAVLGATLAGYWVDEQLGSVPIFSLLGLFLGLAGGTYYTYRLISRFLAKER